MSSCFIAKGKAFDLGWEGGGDRTEEKRGFLFCYTREIFPLNFPFPSRAPWPARCAGRPRSGSPQPHTPAPLSVQCWADVFYTSEIPEIKAILPDDSGFPVVVCCLVGAWWCCCFPPCPLVADLGGGREPAELRAVPEGILQP